MMGTQRQFIKMSNGYQQIEKTFAL